MANTIRIGTFEVSNFKVGLKDPKIYLGDILLYPTGGYKVCYAVVDDITQYSDTEFEDVYDKATEKWYKLNNLNRYEEYGVYGSGRSVTTYNGKLTIDDGYEYEWNGSSWVNVGEISGSSVVEYIETPTSSPYAGIELLTSPSSQSTPMYYELDYMLVGTSSDQRIIGQASQQETVSYQFKFCAYSNPYLDYGGGRLSTNWNNLGGIGNRLKTGIGVYSGDSRVEIRRLDTNTRLTDSSSTPKNVLIPVICAANYNTNTSGNTYTDQVASSGMRYYGIKIYDNNVLVGNYIPSKNPSTNEYTFYETISQQYCSKIGSGTIGGHEEGSVEYPKYYSEKSDPLDNLTFNTMEDAVSYAQNNCVYDGMKATIGTDRYYFDSSDENGWVKVTEYYIVEDVTPSGASGWTISGSSTYNPDSSYYDDFDIETTSTSYSYKIAKVTIYGYDHFTYYLRSYHGYSSYGYVMATNVDEIQTPPSSLSYSSSSAITNTYYFNHSPKSAVNLTNYRRITYNNLDKTVEHTFYVYFYGMTYSSYVGNATILIPKEQTNENWEQVTFSASSNVASTQKNLYIDGNNSTSGGTQYWYHRWIVGLPSGSHSSYTNYSSYDYCPNATSSTFTSVAGEQRQVNFTYDNTSNKTLSFRLTDGSNVLTPSDTVYYNMTYYNSCSVSSSSSNVTFPRSLNVKVGGSFSFSNSSNRHYIYGYQPPTLGTRYYVDNYQSTFDITYTKLSDEAVTITYTTYDPSDVETPAFKTDITWPYNGGTTSSATLTSYAVPYTYPYEVSQTNDKFSADSQSYTANQAARTINFVLYPNNREFASVADLEAYAYAWEGMTAYVGSDKYVYQNGEWVYNPSRLPIGYTEVEYIENTSTAYINTNFKPNQDTRILLTAQCVTSTSYGRYIGAGDYNAVNGIQFDYESGAQGTLHISWGHLNSWTVYSNCVGDYGEHTYDWDKNYFYRDKGKQNQFSATTTYTTFQCIANLGIFCHIYNNGGVPTSQNEFFKGKLYTFKMYDNGTLIRDLVPAKRDSDDKYGMYDIVNDVFYVSPNNVNFNGGDPVI